MAEKRELDTRKSIRVVTANDFITACGLEDISLNARKLLYAAISQCRKTDKEFYEYTISVPTFANLIGVDPSNIYKEADKITDELMKGFIRVNAEKRKTVRKYQLFDMCEYDNSRIKFEVSKKMTDLLLELKGSFTKPLLEDFVRMKSPYSMAIWHVMQREMNSLKPGLTDIIEFELSLEEIRKVTGTEETFKRLSDIKRYVLDKALREIRENCNVQITYTNIKNGRTVVGFHFVAVSQIHVDEEKIPQSVKDKARMFEIKQQSKGREMTEKEKAEYDRLTDGAEQLSLDDYF